MAFGEMRRSEAEGRLPKATAKPPARARGGEAFEVRLRAPKIRFSFRFHFPAQPLGDHTPTTKAPHAPRGEKECQLSRGAESRPSRPDEKKALTPPPGRA